MIPDQIILFIVMLVLSYIFGDRIVPQFAVVLLAVMEILFNLTGSVISTNSAYYIFLFIVNILYAIGKTFVKEDETTGYLERT